MKWLREELSGLIPDDSCSFHAEIHDCKRTFPLRDDSYLTMKERLGILIRLQIA